MVNKIRKSLVQRAYRPKCYEYNNKDEDNSPNIPRDKCLSTSFKNMKQLIQNSCYISESFLIQFNFVV